ncbi:DNA repair protein SWI5-like protein [Armadillidium vulgare]|nr:DNA repair protein SWI5-like protein [Armadillidium vulgare]
MSENLNKSLNSAKDSDAVNYKAKKSFSCPFKSPVVKPVGSPAVNRVLSQKNLSSPLALKTKGSKRSISFNSPFNSPAKFIKKEENLKDELESLETKEALLDKQILELEKEGIVKSEIQEFIDNLHKYNEIKDSAQIVMGRLAELHGITLKEIHLKFGAPTED